MGRSFNLGVYAGIPVKAHWTFGLFLISLLFFGLFIKLSAASLFWFILFIFTLFFCVVLHEYGHALMARRFGVNTRDIILSPIGGLARLERIPREPKQELLIAIAGPIVNLVIAFVLFLALLVLDVPLQTELIYYPTHYKEFLVLVLVTNIGLFVFNLAPAFPMDGGRILRALLAFKLPYQKATFIASVIGRGLAILFMIAGVILGTFMWVFLGGFVFYMAANEYGQVRRRVTMDKTLVSDIANFDFSYLQTQDTIQQAIDLSIQSNQRSFLLKNEFGDLVGNLPEIFLTKAIKDKNEDSFIQDYMSSKNGSIHKDQNIFDAFKLMDSQDLGIISVEDGDEIVAVLDRHTVKRFLNSI